MVVAIAVAMAITMPITRSNYASFNCDYNYFEQVDLTAFSTRIINYSFIKVFHFVTFGEVVNAGIIIT